MSQHIITAYVFMEEGYSADYSRKEWRPEVWKCRVDDKADRIFIGTQQVTVEIPDDFNPVPQQVAALEAEKAAALEQYQRSVADINDRLSKLLAITNEVTQ